MELKFTLKGADKLEKMFSRSSKKMQEGANSAIFVLVNDMRNQAGTKAPYKTGTLRRSITTLFTNLRGEVGSNLEYARIHDQGGTIKAHTIRPRRAKALRFIVGGSVIFAKSARIPSRKVKPYKGRGYLTPAFKNVTKKSNVEKVFLREIARQFK